MAARAKSPVQLYALVGGAVYLVVGIVGFFVTGFTGWATNTDEALFGFDLNAFHNVFHAGAGAALIVVSRIDDLDLAAGVTIGIGLVLLLAGVLGFAGYMNNLLSITDTLAPDNFLHVITGGLAVGLGLSAGETRREPAG